MKAVFSLLSVAFAASSLLLCSLPAHAGLLYVTNEYQNSLSAYDEATGQLQWSQSVGSQTHGVALHAGSVFIGSRGDDTIYKLGAGSFAEVDNPTALMFGSDGKMYVCSDGESVEVFDGQSGAFLNTFATGINRPLGIAQAFDGTIFVGSYGTSTVGQYDLAGNLLNSYFMNDAGGVTIGPDGSVFATSLTDDSVWRLNQGAGQFEVFIPSGSGTLFNPYGLQFGPNGNLFVASQGGIVLEYDGMTGSFIGDFLHQAGGTRYIAFENPVPEPSSLATLATAGLTILRRRRSKPPGCTTATKRLGYLGSTTTEGAE